MKSELRRRLEASVMPVCPECASKNVEGYRYKPIHFDHVVGYVATDVEQVMDDTYRCKDCKAIFHTEA